MREVILHIFVGTYLHRVDSLSKLSLFLICFKCFSVVFNSTARSKETPKRSNNERTSQSMQTQGRQRRREAHTVVLSELRRINRHMQPTVARLPFQRAVREICER